MMLRLMKLMVMTMLSKGRAPTNSQTLGAASCSREKYKRVETAVQWLSQGLSAKQTSEEVLKTCPLKLSPRNKKRL